MIVHIALHSGNAWILPTRNYGYIETTAQIVDPFLIQITTL